jgi:hypothetical protein
VSFTEFPSGQALEVNPVNLKSLHFKGNITAKVRELTPQNIPFTGSNPVKKVCGSR